MNFFQKLCQQLFGMKTGGAAYRGAADVGKLVAPIAQPLIAGYLTKHNLPVDANSALDMLTQAATSKSPLAASIALGLSGYIGQHIELVAPFVVPPVTALDAGLIASGTVPVAGSPAN